jgi:hypothetical protein
LIVKLEKLDQVAAVAFNAFLGIENFRVLDANRAIFFTRHFYADSEIAGFRSK